MSRTGAVQGSCATIGAVETNDLGARQRQPLSMFYEDM